MGWCVKDVTYFKISMENKLSTFTVMNPPDFGWSFFMLYAILKQRSKVIIFITGGSYEL